MWYDKITRTEIHITPEISNSLCFREYGVEISLNTIQTKSVLKKVLLIVNGLVATIAKIIKGRETIRLLVIEKNGPLLTNIINRQHTFL